MHILYYKYMLTILPNFLIFLKQTSSDLFPLSESSAEKRLRMSAPTTTASPAPGLPSHSGRDESSGDDVVVVSRASAGEPLPPYRTIGV